MEELLTYKAKEAYLKKKKRFTSHRKLRKNIEALV
jgi:hypothetical protein